MMMVKGEKVKLQIFHTIHRDWEVKTANLKIEVSI